MNINKKENSRPNRQHVLCLKRKFVPISYRIKENINFEGKRVALIKWCCEIAMVVLHYVENEGGRN